MRLPGYSWNNVLKGMLIYPAGDSIAALLTDQFSITRLIGIMAVGAVVYAWEIPAWFNYINNRYKGFSRAAMAVLYFNPLWIARHLAFICLFSAQTPEIGSGLLMVALKGFAVNLPVVVGANYLIQNVVPLKWRFLSSALFSSALAVYYPLCRVIFK